MAGLRGGSRTILAGVDYRRLSGVRSPLRWTSCSSITGTRPAQLLEHDLGRHSPDMLLG